MYAHRHAGNPLGRSHPQGPSARTWGHTSFHQKRMVRLLNEFVSTPCFCQSGVVIQLQNSLARIESFKSSGSRKLDTITPPSRAIASKILSKGSEASMVVSLGAIASLRNWKRWVLSIREGEGRGGKYGQRSFSASFRNVDATTCAIRLSLLDAFITRNSQ